MTENEIDAAVAAADANASQIGSTAATLQGGIFGLDTLGSPLGENYTENQLQATFGLAPSGGSSTGK